MNPALPTAGTAEHEHSEKTPRKASAVRELFRKFASRTATAVGSPVAFIIAVVIILAWAISGPIFHYSDTWQLVINTGTTIITFLMVFLIQSTQNRDAKAIHLKLDELIARNKKARNRLVDLEDCSDEELEELSKEFDRLRKRAGNHHDHATN
ncbi:MAG TPA: low affinity iron permease family protein [Tepidisphaeraceae bacterium]|nr:low affinity iron permease family protein [Tepidisphaeraceae bacterium]